LRIFPVRITASLALGKAGLINIGRESNLSGRFHDKGVQIIAGFMRGRFAQDIAVTGSMNQQGDIQAIGGINEKIEGFFDVCRIQGLTGTQDILMPASNVEDLMLRDDLLDAVTAGKFHIWPVAKVEEGIEILTGKAAGRRNSDGTFETETVFAAVDERLRDMARTLKEFK
jgi:predicted ATP-dependent protease